VFGQELNAETYAVCRSDMMLKGQDASHIKYGNSFSEDQHEGEHFDYLLANPPFGVEWKKVEHEVRKEAETKGFVGRFGAGLPRINDGSFLFRVGDPPVDHRERLARGRRRPARPALLQHGHLHVLLDRHQPQVAGT
jgi:methylase of polypeptide subunit release factors